MARYNRGLRGKGMTMALGQMVGLLLSLYVFNEVIDAVIPSLVDCATGWTASTNSTISVPLCCNNSAVNCNGVANSTAGTLTAHFSTAVTFVGNLFPVVGILGAFEIIYSALKRAGMV